MSVFEFTEKKKAETYGGFGGELPDIPFQDFFFIIFFSCPTFFFFLFFSSFYLFQILHLRPETKWDTLNILQYAPASN